MGRAGLTAVGRRAPGAAARGGPLSASTRALRPRTSLRRMNSWRRGVQVWPVRVRKAIAAVHSAEVREVSRAKACRCVRSARKRVRVRLGG